MPETRTYQVYEFSELSEQAQEKVLERIGQMNHETYDGNRLNEMFSDKLSEYGFPTDNIEWSLNHSQGDGVAFYGNVNVRQYLKKTKQLTKYRRLLAADMYMLITRNAFGRHYSHFNTMDAEGDTYNLTPKLAELETLLVDDVDERIKEVSRELEKLGYAELEYICSREYILEQIEINEWMFRENGTID